ncbi:hypothetical protein [Aneurinibacillus thermoaerophilus]|uniref:hypothetical protein n=1 Tax=Aneurinibacillus thermoaerophilus TaxID=143495 RepID=UPI002E1BDE6B|nr:hypothetical protein [Aneurinibacillus thermoaerophilus]
MKKILRIFLLFISFAFLVWAIYDWIYNNEWLLVSIFLKGCISLFLQFIFLKKYSEDDLLSIVVLFVFWIEVVLFSLQILFVLIVMLSLFFSRASPSYVIGMKRNLV